MLPKVGNYPVLFLTTQNDDYYKQLCKTSSEYVENNEFVKKQLTELSNYSEKVKSKFPAFPSSTHIGHYWNKGVENTFSFLSTTPVLVSNLVAEVRTSDCI